MLGGQVDFGHGAVEGGEIEERVVSKAACASGRLEDKAFHGAVRGVEGKAVAGGDQDAAVAGGALGLLHAGEALQQDYVVPDIGVVIGVGRIDEAGVSRESGRADTGRTVERIDFEAGVVCEDELAGGEAGVVDGFECGVGGEGEAVFLRSGDGRESGQGFDEDGMSLGGGAEVSELALAGSRGVEAKRHGESVIAATCCGAVARGRLARACLLPTLAAGKGSILRVLRWRTVRWGKLLAHGDVFDEHGFDNSGVGCLRFFRLETISFDKFIAIDDELDGFPNMDGGPHNVRIRLDRGKMR